MQINRVLAGFHSQPPLTTASGPPIFTGLSKFQCIPTPFPPPPAALPPYHYGGSVISFDLSREEWSLLEQTIGQSRQRFQVVMTEKIVESLVDGRFSGKIQRNFLHYLHSNKHSSLVRFSSSFVPTFFLYINRTTNYTKLKDNREMWSFNKCFDVSLKVRKEKKIVNLAFQIIKFSYHSIVKSWNHEG